MSLWQKFELIPQKGNETLCGPVFHVSTPIRGNGNYVVSLRHSGEPLPLDAARPISRKRA